MVKEIKYLLERGYNHFHLCDSEFNLNLEYSLNILREIRKNKLDIRWALYMKPRPYSEELFKSLKESGAYLVTLSIESYPKSNPGGKYTLKDIQTIRELTKKYKIKLVVDLLTGFPYEEIESVKETIEFLRRIKPDSVGINTYLRIYSSTRLRKIVERSKDLRKRLIRKSDSREGYLEPTYYNNIDISFIKELIKGEKNFKIEGFERTTNYQRL